MRDSTPTELYNAAFYFISVTLMTVGYGDISGSNFGERAFCIPLVLLGAAAFAYGVGSINSIVGNYDSQQALVRQKLHILHSLKRDGAPLTAEDMTDMLRELTNEGQDCYGSWEEELSLSFEVMLRAKVEVYKRQIESSLVLNGRGSAFIKYLVRII
jgi:Ion channel